MGSAGEGVENKKCQKSGWERMQKVVWAKGAKDLALVQAGGRTGAKQASDGARDS